MSTMSLLGGPCDGMVLPALPSERPDGKGQVFGVWFDVASNDRRCAFYATYPLSHPASGSGVAFFTDAIVSNPPTIEEGN